MITDREYKELLEKYGFEVEYRDGYIRNDEYIWDWVHSNWSLISKWYSDGTVFIYDRITIQNMKIIFEPVSVGCSSPKVFENKLQNLVKKIKIMKEQIKLLKMKEMF